MEKKRYAHVGIGGRARMYYQAIAKTYPETAELVAFCDINQTRMDYANRVLEGEFGYHAVPTYTPDRFEEMIKETRPDVVIVTSYQDKHTPRCQLIFHSTNLDFEARLCYNYFVDIEFKQYRIWYLSRIPLQFNNLTLFEMV